MKKIILAVIIILAARALFAADNRYALVIGNSNYRDKSISSLVNPVNDATDVAAALKGLGYNVTLKTNIGLRDMLNVVKDFTGDLRRSPDTEGFFWFAGHGLSVRGIHYMLPVDVDPADDNIIARGAFSVDDLMEEIGNARNKTNLIVIDACRNTLVPGGGNRAVGTRGLAVLSADDYRVTGNKIVYSTMAGRTASDGLPGTRNSPFAQAFLSKIQSHEIFEDVFLDIANETLRLTRGDQQPYSMGSFAVKSYTLNPAPPPQVAAAPAVAPQTPVAPLPAPDTPNVTPTPPKETRPPKEPREATNFTLDGKRGMSLSAGPNINTLNGSFGAVLNFTFFEKYGEYRETFLIPNAFFFSAELIRFTADYNLTVHNWTYSGQQAVTGGVWNLGALYKIRLEESQKFLFNFGMFFSLFTVKNNTDIDYTTSYGEAMNYKDNGVIVQPGAGVDLGLGFRFTPSLSLDLGLRLNMAFKDESLRKLRFHSLIQDGDMPVDDAKSPLPHLNASLGLRWWLPGKQ